MSDQTLSQYAFSLLSKVDPNLWDSLVYQSFVRRAKEDNHTKEDAENEWQDALDLAKKLLSASWQKYEKLKGIVVHYTALPWESVKLTGGTSDGETYILNFDVDGRDVFITCKDSELENPAFVLRKLQFSSARLIDCPYITKQGQKNWLPSVVFPWLNSIKMDLTIKENPVFNVEDAIIDYASKPIWKERLGALAFEQTREPVIDGDTVYIPAMGCYDYVRKAVGAEHGPRFMQIALKRLGAVKRQKGDSRRRFWAVNWLVIQTEKAKIESGEAHKDEIVESPVFSGWDGLDAKQEKPVEDLPPELDSTPF